EHGAAVMAGPVEDVHIEVAQVAIARLAHADVVEGGDQVAALGEPGGKGRVIALRHAHGGYYEYRALHFALRAEPVGADEVAVAVVDPGFCRTGHCIRPGVERASGNARTPAVYES